MGFSPSIAMEMSALHHPSLGSKGAVAQGSSSQDVMAKTTDCSPAQNTEPRLRVVTKDALRFPVTVEKREGLASQTSAAAAAVPRVHAGAGPAADTGDGRGLVRNSSTHPPIPSPLRRPRGP